MKVTDELIDHLANLSRLSFKPEEKEAVRIDLEKMISFIEKLKEVDTTGVEPLLFMSDEVTVLREDVVEGSISQEVALQNAPVTDGKFFKVPKVIRK